MGSTISIVNDTEDTWLCRVGPDEKALRISSIVAASIAALGLTVATAGAAGLVAPASLISSGSAIYAAKTFVLGGSIISYGVTPLLYIEIVHTINRGLLEKGYHKILSGTTYETGKLSLSLWQQATCVGHKLSSTELSTKTLYMRPIFSGATHKSTKSYSIKEYLEGKGKVEEQVIKLEPNGTSSEPTPIPN
jgi:hypothetical protein